jgi:hypothetical protein
MIEQDVDRFKVTKKLPKNCLNIVNGYKKTEVTIQSKQNSSASLKTPNNEARVAIKGSKHI